MKKKPTKKPSRTADKPRIKVTRSPDPPPPPAPAAEKDDGRVYFAATRHVARDGDDGVESYIASIPIDLIYPHIFALRREDDSVEGFQRHLDEKKVQGIADYLDNGGIIPGSITISAQPESDIKFEPNKRNVNFLPSERAFFSIDGQHRTEGFFRAKRRPLRILVEFITGLARKQEAAIFTDVNHKQTGVSSALITDIQALAGRESAEDGSLRELFDMLATEPGTPMEGLMDAAGARGKLNRVTFNGAVRPLLRDEEFRSMVPDAKANVLMRYLSVFSDTALQDRTLLAKPAVFASVTSIMLDVLRASGERFGKHSLVPKKLAVVVEPLRGKHLREDGRLRAKGDMIAELRAALRGKVAMSLTSKDVEEAMLNGAGVDA